MELVVAHYPPGGATGVENLMWINGVQGVKKTVYNKGPYDLCGEIKLPNVGREAQTYLHHIVANYNHLPEWTFFSQGEPVPHCHDIVQMINEFPRSADRAKMSIGDGAYFFSDNGAMDVEKTAYHGGYTINGKSGVHIVWRDNVEWLWKQLFETVSIPKTMVFVPCCTFAAASTLLLTRSLEFYKKALQITEARETAPWEFERLFCFMWPGTRRWLEGPAEVLMDESGVVFKGPPNWLPP